MVVENPEKAHSVLRDANHAVKETDVIAIEVPDHPGGLCDLLKTLEECSVNIEYMYTVLERKRNNAVIVLRVDNTDQVIESLKNRNVRLLSSKEVYGLL